jgi:hypothetical protein
LFEIEHPATIAESISQFRTLYSVFQLNDHNKAAEGGRRRAEGVGKNNAEEK